MFTPDYQETVRNATSSAQMPLVQMVQRTQQRFKALLANAAEGDKCENQQLSRLAAADVVESMLVKQCLVQAGTPEFMRMDKSQRAIQMQIFIADELVSIVMSKASSNALNSVIPTCIDKFLTAAT